MLALRDVVAGYGHRMVLDGVSFTVDPGDRVSLIGHNGAGKSTIIKAIVGQIPVSRGEILLRGAPLKRPTPEGMVASGVVQVPAGRRVFPKLSVTANLKLGAFTRRDQKAVLADLEKMYDRFEVLAQKRDTKAGVLSGGEQQMLAIARGAMARPTLLLVDEPSLGLSPIMVDEVFGFLDGLVDERMALILAEQNVRKALSITSHAVVLSQGAIVSELASDTLMSDSDFRRAYLGASD